MAINKPKVAWNMTHRQESTLKRALIQAARHIEFIVSNDDGEYNLYKVGARKGNFKQRKILQGEMIEHPDYMNWNDEQKEINYSHYISNQIMNPVKQVLDITMNPDETKQIFEKYI
mgnify:CR=1 FL=1